jgi:hypothetical protein
MRRVLLGGLGIALGVFVRPAAAQDFPAAARPDPVTRAARLGRPVATPDTPPANSGVTPVGLLTRSPMAAPVVQPAPVGSPVPVAGPIPMVMPPGYGVAPAYPLTAPRVVGSDPSVTMIRDAAPVAGAPADPNGVVVIPPVGPADLGGVCPVPLLDTPAYGAAPGAAPRFPALSRLMGCTHDRWWLGGEYLGWWTRSTQLPVLAATGPIPASLADPVTTPVPVLSGSFGQTLHGGARFSGGWWFSDDQRRGIDTRFLFLFRNGTGFTTNSAQFPVLGRPFFNVNDPVGPLTDVIGAPGRSSGGLAVHLDNSLWGAEVNYRRFLAGNPCFRLDGLVGYRYLNFSETLTITETGIVDPNNPMLAAGRAPFATATDRFRTENNFHGGQVGLTAEARRGRWFVNGRGSIAFGTVFQTAEIAGGQTQAFPNGTAGQFAGGLLALPGANIGTFNQSKFAVLPEVGLNLGYHVTPNMRVFVGYNFLYLSSVLRPANVIDPMVDASRVPNFLPNPAPVLAGVPRPSPQFNTTDFWAQGISFGLQWTW